jgi:hypothetical protein
MKTEERSAQLPILATLVALFACTNWGVALLVRQVEGAETY